MLATSALGKSLLDMGVPKGTVAVKTAATPDVSEVSGLTVRTSAHVFLWRAVTRLTRQIASPETKEIAALLGFFGVGLALFFAVGLFFFLVLVFFSCCWFTRTWGFLNPLSAVTQILAEGEFHTPFVSLDRY